MKRAYALLLALTLCCLPALAQDWAKQTLEKSSRHQEWVQIKNGDRVVHTFVVYPEVKEKAPVVLVVHEIFGLTDWVRTVADKLAANGYIAIAPDFLSGLGPNGGRSTDFPSVDAAREVNSKLDSAQVMADLNAVADYAKKLPASNGKLAVGGFCWGGKQSFFFATKRKDLGAAYVFYGSPAEDFAAITAPVYGFYGGNDARINATIPATEEGMKKAGKKYEPVTYEGAGHGFMRTAVEPTKNNAADKKAHDEGWARWLELLKKL
jgi:carboxymethylenebutenolidase